VPGRTRALAEGARDSWTRGLGIQKTEEAEQQRKVGKVVGTFSGLIVINGHEDHFSVRRMHWQVRPTMIVERSYTPRLITPNLLKAGFVFFAA
jgi:hypothetical protein